MALGVQQSLAHTTAWSSKDLGGFTIHRSVQIALSIDYFDGLGLPKLSARLIFNSIELLCTGSYAKWRGRGKLARFLPIPILSG